MIPKLAGRIAPIARRASPYVAKGITKTKAFFRGGFAPAARTTTISTLKKVAKFGAAAAYGATGIEAVRYLYAKGAGKPYSPVVTPLGALAYARAPFVGSFGFLFGAGEKGAKAAAGEIIDLARGVRDTPQAANFPFPSFYGGDTTITMPQPANLAPIMPPAPIVAPSLSVSGGGSNISPELLLALFGGVAGGYLLGKRKRRKKYKRRKRKK